MGEQRVKARISWETSQHLKLILANEPQKKFVRYYLESLG